MRRFYCSHLKCITSGFFSYKNNIPIKMISNTAFGKNHSNGVNGHAANGTSTDGPMRGAFIVFEGLDKSGKSSQAKSVVERLNQNGIAAALMKFPTREGPVGALIDQYLRKEINLTDESIHLLFSTDRWEHQNSLQQLLLNGVSVIVDRYAYSGIAFSSAKGLDLNWCAESDARLLAPDRVLFLNVSTNVALERQGFGDERYEKTEFQSKVRQQYERLMDREKKLGNAWTIFNADRKMDEVHEDIYREVLSIIQDLIPDAPLRKLFIE